MTEEKRIIVRWLTSKFLNKETNYETQFFFVFINISGIQSIRIVRMVREYCPTLHGSDAHVRRGC